MKKLKESDVVVVSKEKKFWMDAEEKSIKEVETYEAALKLSKALLEKIKEKVKNAP
jgi:hypothetical protein|tara:strand:- start:600 stop:767 length:168 start_codon:yes stop_codon:yes gene_type:complete